MKVRETSIQFETKDKIELVDLTVKVQNFVRNADIAEGFCMIFTKHSTATIVVNENEPGLKEDIIQMAKNIIPGGDYKHNKIDTNATSHLAATIFSPSKIFPISKGILEHGPWQSIFFLELDGPRGIRKVTLKALGN